MLSKSPYNFLSPPVRICLPQSQYNFSLVSHNSRNLFIPFLSWYSAVWSLELNKCLICLNLRRTPPPRIRLSVTPIIGLTILCSSSSPTSKFDFLYLLKWTRDWFTPLNQVSQIKTMHDQSHLFFRSIKSWSKDQDQKGSCSNSLSLPKLTGHVSYNLQPLVGLKIKMHTADIQVVQFLISTKYWVTFTTCQDVLGRLLDWPTGPNDTPAGYCDLDSHYFFLFHFFYFFFLKLRNSLHVTQIYMGV